MHSQVILRSLVWCALMSLVAVASLAQTPVTIADPSSATVRIGAVGLTPRVSISDVGIDTNVFASVENPQQDTTAAASAGTDLWLRTGRGLFYVQADADYLYFDRFASERSLNSEARARYEIRLNRLVPYAWASTGDFKRRPNDEIVARVRHFRSELGGGLSTRLWSRTTARVEWQRSHLGYGDTARFDGHDLRTQLNQRRDTVGLSMRQQLTALTTFVTRVTHDRNEFEFERQRNSDSVHVDAGFELGQFALIRGTAMFGYHHLRADDPVALPEFSGMTSNVDVAYTAPTQTRLQAIIERALQQSYDPRAPHYTESTFTGIVTQRLSGRWDVQLTGGRTRQVFLDTPLSAGRTDVTDRISGGIGYALAGQARAGLDVSSVHRRSPLPRRDYRGLIGGFSLTYGY